MSKKDRSYETVVQQEIASVCDEIKDLLISKNRAYGNSALDPRRIFSTSSAVEQIRVRVDDKLSRIQTLTNDAAAGEKVFDESLEDTKRDLIGYLVLEMVARRLG